MKAESDLIKRLRPKFSQPELEQLNALDSFMDNHHLAISAQIRKELKSHEVIGPIIRKQPETELIKEDKHSRCLQKEAICNDKWDNYTIHLLNQGMLYAQMGMEFSDWSRVIMFYQDCSLPVIQTDLRNNANQLISVLNGLNKMVVYAQAVISESYFIEKNKLIADANLKVEKTLSEFRKSNERFKALFENCTDHVLMVNPEGTIEYINHVPAGLKRDEVVGSNLFDYQVEGSRKLVEESIATVFETGRSTVYTSELSLPVGSRFHTTSVAPIFSGMNKVEFVALVSRDDTERVINSREVSNLKEQLERKVEQLDLVLTIGKIGIWDWDFDTNHITWDKTMYELYDLDKDEFQNRYSDFEGRVHEDDRQKIQLAVQRSIETDTDFNTEFRIVHRNGSVHYVTGRGKVTYDANGKPLRMNGSNMDITEIVGKQLEIDNITRAIYKSNLVVEFNTEGIITNVNGAFLKLMGYQANEVIGKHHSIFVTPEEKKSKAYEHFWKRLKSGTYHEGEYERVKKNKDTVWIKGNYNPIVHANGEVHGILKIATDLTLIKHAEAQSRLFNKKLEATVQQRTTELQAINQELADFSYTVSHDLRAPIRAIDGFSKVLTKNLNGQLDQRSRHYLDVIVENTERMGHLIDDLLSFSRMGRLDQQLAEYDMFELVQRVIETESQGRDVSNVTFEVEPLIPCLSDKAMIRQVWANLINNALKFSSPDKGAIINISSQEEPERVVYKITDNGVGFEMEFVGKIYGIFQRLHSDEEFEGTGVGLAIVARIVERHGGEAWAESDLGKGSTFYFSLPLIKEL